MHSHQYEVQGKRLLVAIWLNVAITIAQVVGGLISGSLALISDSLHNFSDVSALLISYIANKLTLRKSTSDKTYGYKRAEILAAFINSASLILVAGFLIFEAVRRLTLPSVPEIISSWIIVLAAFSILANGISVLIIQKDAKHNMNIKSAYLHLFTDMLSSVAVLGGGLLIYYFQIYWIDPVISMLIAFYLIIISWNLISKTLGVLMQFAPKEINLENIAEFVKSFPEVHNIHHVHLWQLDDNNIHFEAHLEIKEDYSISHVCKCLQNIEAGLIEKYKITHITLQPEIDRNCEEDLVSQENDRGIKKSPESMKP